MPIEKTSILEMHRLSTEEYRTSPKVPLSILLDNVRSLHNVGAIFRTADAFLIEELILVGITGSPPHPLIHKTAIGAEEAVPWRHLDTAAELLEQYRWEHRTILALEQTHQSISLGMQPPLNSHGAVLIVGNEVHGISEETLQYADYCLEIPQYGTKHSLNVSIATGIAIYDICASYLKRVP
jgi:rRNA methylases